jgi:hypothetical protein
MIQKIIIGQKEVNQGSGSKEKAASAEIAGNSLRAAI